MSKITAMSDLIAKDTSAIPEGPYCYTPLGWDGDAYRVKPCPYISCTDHGTISCKFLGVESLDPTPGSSRDADRELAYKHFGGEEEAWEATESGGLIWDSVKECGINDKYEEEDDI